jgi:hypothetical protein
VMYLRDWCLLVTLAANIVTAVNVTLIWRQTRKVRIEISTPRVVLREGGLRDRH